MDSNHLRDEAAVVKFEEHHLSHPDHLPTRRHHSSVQGGVGRAVRTLPYVLDQAQMSVDQDVVIVDHEVREPIHDVGRDKGCEGGGA